MKFLIIGDIVGRPGRTTLFKYLEKRKQNYDFIIVNGENSAGGFGINVKIAKEMFERGADVITLGNHSWDKREIYSYINEQKNLIRPINYTKEAPGSGYTIVEKNGVKVAVINAQCKVFMPPIACPFLAVEEVLPQIKEQTDIIILDFHGEATSEKQAMGWNLSGKVSAVYGTHTHTQTADERILPGGTGYISDIGMTGSQNGVIGTNLETIINKFLTLPKFSACVARTFGKVYTNKSLIINY